jgi:signal transduction histidine kinase
MALQDSTLVVDNGTGAEPDTAQPATTAAGMALGGGRGRANMRNRAQRLGGQVEWQAQAPGTRVCLRAPWRVPSSTNAAHASS